MRIGQGDAWHTSRPPANFLSETQPCADTCVVLSSVYSSSPSWAMKSHLAEEIAEYK